MNINLSGKQPTFRQNKPGLNTSYRLLVLLFLLLGSFFLIRSIKQNQIVSPFADTPVPTRTANSFEVEGNTRFVAGDLNGAITALRQATALDPNNADLLSGLARIQVYSSGMLTTDALRRTRLEEALASIERAVKLAPDDSTAHAVRAFVLDWSSNPTLAGDKSLKLLNDAEQEAVRAIQLDNHNALAMAFYAEILADQFKWLQAQQYISQALERDPTLMDVHRVNAYVLETLGEYGIAIDEYKKAAEITPNLTFLYLAIGANYRQLKQNEMALEFFAKAVTIDEQLGIKDPGPYLSIGKTYAQMGEFFSASRNMFKALSYSPDNPDTYGQLGVVYYKSRNYEGSIPALKCAVLGCTPKESCEVRQCDDTKDAPLEIKGLPLSPSTVVFYFTYASALAGMARPNNDYCPQAKPILAQLTTIYAKDDSIMSIVNANTEICSSLGFK